jgi:hypothetical protein
LAGDGRYQGRYKKARRDAPGATIAGFEQLGQSGDFMGVSGPRRPDSSVDAIAAVLIVAAVVVGVSLWLAGMPS